MYIFKKKTHQFLKCAFRPGKQNTAVGLPWPCPIRQGHRTRIGQGCTRGPALFFFLFFLFLNSEGHGHVRGGKKGRRRVSTKIGYRLERIMNVYERSKMRNLNMKYNE